MKCRITLRQIEGFLLACEHPSFSAASAEMGITQSAFSQLIRELELQLNVQLFVRTTRRVTLTAAGEAMQATMRRGIDSIDAAVDEAVAISRGEQGHIRTAAITSLALGIVTRTLVRLRSELPGITVSMREGDNDAVVNLADVGDVDLAFCAEVPSAPGLVFDYLFDDELMLVTTPGSRLSTKDSARWTDLVQEQLVLTRPGTSTRDHVSASLKRHAIVKPVDVEVTSMMTALSMVKAGFGCAFVSSVALQSVETQGLVTLPIAEPAIRRIGIYRKPDRPLSMAARKLIDLLLDEVPNARRPKHRQTPVQG